MRSVFRLMPLTKGLFSGSVLRICIAVGVLSLWLLIELNIEKADLTLFIPQIYEDSHLINRTVFYSGFLVNTNGCRIPDLDTMDISIRKYIYDDKPIRCKEHFGPALVESNLTSVYINETVLSDYNVTELSQLSCCYTPFWRVEAKKKLSGSYPPNVDSLTKYANYCTPFIGSTRINHEFIKIECFANNNSIYTDFHPFFPAKKTSNQQDEEGNLNNTNAVSVLVVGVDAVSRLNLHRQMPQTLKFLEKTLNAVEMLGYNKVEDNTFPNLIPVLTGLSVDELKETCWPKTHYVFDDCNFIWNNFSSIGYKTAFGEDASWMGIFNYIKRGFRTQPTDYYMSVFNKVSEDSIGFEKRLNAKLCTGPRKSLESLLNYAYKFVIAMKDVLSFSFFWGTSLSHDYLNLPKYGDKDHREFLELLYGQGIFNNTILVFMSDHGIRWGEFRGTYQGYLEERLPFLFIVYPKWFRIKYTTAVSNLKKNAQRLTTPFDLHELLKDITDLTQLETKVLKERSDMLLKTKPLSRGISLFLPIPGSRTCSDAGINDHWCTCHQSTYIPLNNTHARRAANYLVKHVNGLLEEYNQCVKLRLRNILSAREEKSTSHSNFKTSDIGIRDLTITIETTPGKALFEATVRHDGNKDSFTVVGTISRINLYGDQSRCMPNYKLRLYCYCSHD